MSANKVAFKGVLLDLDGTLLDTAPDLGRALNNLLAVRKLPLISYDLLRPVAGRGCKGLLKMGFDMDDTHEEYLAYCDELLNNYNVHIFDNTTLFTGMEDLLTHLNQSQIPWGIVTNKPHRFTKQLVAHVPELKASACVISGDTLENRKPHPKPILHACEILQLQPRECLYVGDSEIDIIASRAAGTCSIAALYGYIPPGENPQNWNADGYIEQPGDILKWL